MRFVDVYSIECSFGTLKMGDVFECKGEIYMKTRRFHMDDGYEATDMNSFRLYDGELEFIPDDEIVIKREDLCLTSVKNAKGK